MGALKLILPSPVNLSNDVDETEKREENISNDKVAGVEGRQCHPALKDSENKIRRDTKPRHVWEQHSLEGQFRRATTLDGPAPTEADVDEADGRPDEERAHAGEVDDVAVGLGGTRGDVHHGDGADGVGDEDGPDGDAAAVDPAEDLGRLSGLRHVEDCSGADVDG